MTVNYQKTSFKTAVLSLSLLTIMSGAGIAPGIHKIAEVFPETSETIIKMIISFPPLFMIFTALLSGVLGQFVKHKVLIVAGLMLFVIGGVGAGYMNSIPMILTFRAILGIGTGIILPFSTGLIAACFDGNFKTKMMGYSSATNSLGAIIGNISAGVLAVGCWRYMFHIYWLGALVLIYVLLFLNRLPQTEDGKASKEKLPPKVYAYSVFAFMIMMVFYLIVTNLSFFVDARQLGTAKITGFLFAVSSLSMLVGGVLIPFFMKMKRFFLPFVFILLAVGIFGISRDAVLPVLFLSVISAGFSLGLLYPYLLNSLSNCVSKSLSVKAMSVGMASAWFGQFASPLFFGGIAKVLGVSTVSVFVGLAIVILLVGMCFLLSPRKTGQ